MKLAINKSYFILNRRKICIHFHVSECTRSMYEKIQYVPLFFFSLRLTNNVKDQMYTIFHSIYFN